MVAYSFKRMFVDPIRAGVKRQTIRADRARHARPGEQLQLYCGQRTKHCFLIGRATCLGIDPIRIDFSRHVILIGGQLVETSQGLADFAVRDGFEGWAHMREFWFAEHPVAGSDGQWSGWIITWEQLAA